MTVTIDADKSNAEIDDLVDDEIAACLSLEQPRSFFLFAGAGSGKTRSLVRALGHIRESAGAVLALRSQRVGVITYTNAACDEIQRRIRFDPRFHISTIHSFAWDLIRGFNPDIREWLRASLTADIAELEQAERAGRAGTKASQGRLAQLDSKRDRLARLDEIRKFIYSPTGDNRARESLNHADVIKICSSFLSGKPLMQHLLVNRFPIVLIDESQDTNGHLIDAFLLVQSAHRAHFSLGLLGDSMQRIYNDGKERIEDALPKDWITPLKRINHRCPRRIVRLINQIRADVDSLTQEARSDSAEGCVRLFILPFDVVDKSLREDHAREQMATFANDPDWERRDRCKILMLEHHLAATRMGFDTLFEALYQIDEFRTGILDGTFPALRFYTDTILPLVLACERGDKFSVGRIVRERSPLLEAARLKTSVAPLENLKVARDAVDSLMSLWKTSVPTCGAVLANVTASGLFAIPEILQPLVVLSQEPHVSDADQIAAQADLPSDRIAALEKFLKASFAEICPFDEYISHRAPFDTQQGVKGMEFDRVMVVMDDADARGFMFGYEKFLGAVQPSSTDIKNAADGRETTIDRTRRLFYVSCSRARRSLALVAYSKNPQAIRAHALRSEWFSDDEIILQA